MFVRIPDAFRVVWGENVAVACCDAAPELTATLGLVLAVSLETTSSPTIHKIVFTSPALKVRKCKLP